MTDTIRKADDLAERVRQFERMELLGQPMMMHMGTYYLVAIRVGEVFSGRAKAGGR